MSIVVDQSTETPAKARRRRAGLGVCLVSLAILLRFAPIVVARTDLRNHALAWLFSGIDGTVSARGALLGWFSPVVLQDVTLADAEERTAIHAARVEGRKPLLDLVFSPRELGRFRAVGTRLEVTLEDGTSNLERILLPWLTGDGGSEDGTAVELEIDDATAVLLDSASGMSLDVPQLSLLLTTPRRGAEVKLTARAERLHLSPELCEHGLQYIAPVLAGAAEAEGMVSIDVSDCRIPTADPTGCELAGTLTVHHAQLAGSPLVQSLAGALRLPATARIKNESTIPFRMADHRVEHQGLEVAIGNLTVRVDGSVGLDQSLDLVAEVPLTSQLVRGMPESVGLERQVVRVPISGTLERPRIDPKALGRSLDRTLRQAAQNAVESEIDRQLRRLLER